jgi:hypothetical protein
MRRLGRANCAHDAIAYADIVVATFCSRAITVQLILIVQPK